MRLTKIARDAMKLPVKAVESLIREIECGLPPELSARYVGVSRKQFLSWMDQGEEGLEPFDKIYAAITKAHAKHIREQVHSMRRHGRKSWLATAWMLERTAPEYFGKPDVSPGAAALDVEITIGGEPT